MGSRFSKLPLNMGQGYSAEDQPELNRCKSLVNEAVRDKAPYEKFRKSADTLTQDLRSSKRLA